MVVPALNRGGACTGPTLAVQARSAAGSALFACSQARPASAHASTGPAGARQLQHTHDVLTARAALENTFVAHSWLALASSARRRAAEGGPTTTSKAARRSSAGSIRRRGWCAAPSAPSERWLQSMRASPPWFSVLGARGPERTVRGQQENVKAVVCAAEGCTTMAAFGYLGQQRQFCRAHRLAGMVRPAAAQPLLAVD
jgi:hypothetical protein